MRKLVIEVLYQYRSEKRFLVHEFVIMPNHFHLLITPNMGCTLEKSLQLVKGDSSREAGLRFRLCGEVWQRGFTDHRIRDRKDYRTHVEYIHLNPVRARLVVEPNEYPYSSAHLGFELDASPKYFGG